MGRTRPRHLLDVPAGKLALPDDPSHFVRFAQSALDPSVTPGTFVRRSVYGAYLESMLTEAGQSRAGALEQIVAEVNGVEPKRAWVTMTTVDGQRITVDRMVLAVGHSPATSERLAPDFLASPYYVRDPWVRGGPWIHFSRPHQFC